MTRNHAMLAERLTRYLRWHLRDLQAQHRCDWGVWVKEVVKHYNNGTDEKPTHTTTYLNPNEGHEDKNALEVKLNLVMQAKHNRKYPEIHTGYTVKICPQRNSIKGTCPTGPTKLTQLHLNQSHMVLLSIIQGRERGS